MSTIGDRAFGSCSSLNSVVFHGTVDYIGFAAFYSCSQLSSITLPQGLKNIAKNAFQYCGLTAITLPNSLSSIGEHALDCENLMTIVSLIKEPFEISGVTSETRSFSYNSFMNATIYVPNGTKDKYKDTLGWKDFQKIVEETSNIVSLESNTILIHSQDGKLYFTSIPNGTRISIYSTSGLLAGSIKASGTSTSVATNLCGGEIAIIKIGTKVVKFVMK